MKKAASFITSLFEEVASSYDLMNDLMSLGIHRYWKKTFVNLIPQFPSLKMLDLAGGTGDVAIQYYKKYSALSPTIMVVDPVPQMLEKAKAKAINHNIWNLKWIIGSAEQLPFEDNTFDVCTMAFGLRNTENREKSLQEIQRVLKPGGQFLCLEFSQVDEDIQKAYKAYIYEVVPRLGKLVAKNQKAYEYLAESIASFYTSEELKDMLYQAGFHSIQVQRLSKGIVAIHQGWKE